MINVMKKSPLEPGLLQVFRLYAWLKLIAFGIFFILFLHLHLANGSDRPFMGILVVLLSLILLGILYWPWLQDHIGRYYIPLALIVATGELIIEQHLSSLRQGPWLWYPFLNILVILIAWQYSYLNVVWFTLVVISSEVLLNWLFPRSFTPLAADSPAREYFVTYAFMLSSLVTFLVLGYVVNRLIKAQRAHRQELAEANQKLVRHASAQEQLATSRERVRLSRELHDTLAHTLSAQAVQFEALLTVGDELPPKALSILEQMQTATQTGLDETRRTLRALRASPLEELGLPAALRTLVEDFTERYSMKLELDIPDDADDLPAEVEQTFYRVAQETLENVARHSNARCLTVQMTRKMGRILLMLKDDGRGFSLQETPGDSRLGLVGMRERAELIGADLVIDSRPGQGTSIRLEWEQS
jgi:signal transduction histidine kinase